MKKKIAATAVLLSLLSISAAGTLAYFTDSQIAHNVITSGKIDIDLNDDFDWNEPIMPSQEIDKVVSVTNNNDSNTAWVRILLNTTITKNDTQETKDLFLPDGNPVMKINISQSGKWVKGTAVELDGVSYDSYIYKDELAPGATTEELFKTVTFNEKTGNDYQNCTVNIDVVAQAIQSDNNGASALEAAGWPAE